MIYATGSPASARSAVTVFSLSASCSDTPTPRRHSGILTWPLTRCGLLPTASLGRSRRRCAAKAPKLCRSVGARADPAMAHSRSIKYGIWSWQMFGQTDVIAWVLRSGRELTQTDRDWLADFVEGKVRLPPGKPPLAYMLNSHRTLAIEAAEIEVKRRVAEARAGGSSSRGLP